MRDVATVTFAGLALLAVGALLGVRDWLPLFPIGVLVLAALHDRVTAQARSRRSSK